MRFVLAVRDADTPVLKLSGDLDIATVPQLESALETWGSGRSTVVLDLTEISFFDSSAVGVLVDWYSRLSRSGGGLYVEGASPHVRAVLEAMELWALFDPGRPAGESPPVLTSV